MNAAEKSSDVLQLLARWRDKKKKKAKVKKEGNKSPRSAINIPEGLDLLTRLTLWIKDIEKREGQRAQTR